MSKRIVFGSVLIAAVVGIFSLDWYLSHSGDETSVRLTNDAPALPIVVTLLVLLAVGFIEVGRLTRAAGIRLLGVSGLLLGWAILLLTWLPATLQTAPLDILLIRSRLAGRPLVLLTIAVSLVFAEQMIRRRLDDALRTVAATVFAAMYLGLGLAAILAIRLQSGAWLLLTFLAAVKFTDIGAYFAGSFLGRHKMIPWLSPGKSWEGLIGGLAAAAGVAYLMGHVVPATWNRLPLLDRPWWFWLVFGATVGVVGQFGDLCESLLKRSAGAKDSGALVPEFGGILDMIDSPLLAAPIAWLLLAF